MNWRWLCGSCHILAISIAVLEGLTASIFQTDQESVFLWNVSTYSTLCHRPQLSYSFITYARRGISPYHFTFYWHFCTKSHEITALYLNISHCKSCPGHTHFGLSSSLHKIMYFKVGQLLIAAVMATTRKNFCCLCFLGLFQNCMDLEL
jgi:hypothetical protein